MAKYISYPFKIMRITQNYNGTTSHKPHTSGNYKDYPIDEAGKDGGKEPIYAPCDVKVVKKYGVGNRGTNTIWVQSVDKVKFANGQTNYLIMLITHPNDADLINLKEGQVIKKGKIITYEGNDGATGNHIHLSVGMGSIMGTGWIQNSNGKWVLYCTGGTLKPEQAFYLDKDFTTVKSSGGLTFKALPKETAEEKLAKELANMKGNYKVTTDVLNVRKTPGLKGAIVSYKDMTANAKTKIKQLAKREVNGYVKGLTFTVSEVKFVDNLYWGKTPSGWVALKHCVKI